MANLNPGERKEILYNFIDSAKINIFHFIIGLLMSEELIDCVITTNFDLLVDHATTLFHINPQKYDIANNVSIIGHDISFPSIIYLHGEYRNVWQLNTDQELQKSIDDIKAIISQIASKQVTWVVIGYSGNDPVFDELAKVQIFNQGLYWIGYEEDPPIPKVEDQLLSNPNNNAKLVSGYNSDTFANHVFLDRKESGNVGFVNDFIFGLLIGENLISGKYKEYYDDFYKIIPQTFAVLAVTAFRIYSEKKQIELWDIFNSYAFEYDQSFYFNIDLLFKEQISRDYEQIEVKDIEISNIRFDSANKFNQVVFSNVVFTNCEFDLNSFNECSFITCSFYDCEIIRNLEEAFKSNFQLFSCRDNNGFIVNVFSTDDTDIQEEVNEITHFDILEKFFNVGNVNPRHRELSNLRKEFGYNEFKEASDLINDLETDGYLVLDGDIGHLTKE